MPEKAVTDKAKHDLDEGKSPSTAAGEFVHEEIEHVREGKHGARSPQQAIAIGLSEARRAGIPLKAPAKGKTSAATRKKVKRDAVAGKSSTKTHEGTTARSKARAKSATKALKREPRDAVSHEALSEHAKKAAKNRKSSAS